MIPRPMKAMFVMSMSPKKLAAALEREPAEAFVGGGGRLVLEPDQAGVAVCLEGGQLLVERQGAGSGLAPAGRVGDLYVRDPRGVLGDHPLDVVPVDRKVVEVS